MSSGSPSEPAVTPRSTILAVLILLAAFIVYGVVVWRLAGSDKGVFGDMFGALNAFVSGVAMLGVVAAIFLQKRELQLQRQELEETRRELARSAHAQEESHRVLRDTLHAQTFGVAVGILQSEATRQARRKVLDRYANENFKSVSSLPQEAREAAEIVCHTYDSVGLMVRHGLIPANHIAFPYSDSLRKCWRILEPLVAEYRRGRGAPTLWLGFQELAQQAQELPERH